jgi:hypothetical protein
MGMLRYASELGTADISGSLPWNISTCGSKCGQDPMHPVGYVSAGAHEGKAAASLRYWRVRPVESL